jgi:2-amino-4-hydroxy-6-hydroxymethyldihydropteridine diphosphokinase
MDEQMEEAGPRVFLSLGSNLGSRLSNISEAIRCLESSSIRVLRCSSVYQTEPVDVKSQNSFINIACEVATQLELNSLLDACELAEKALGRARKGDNAPRIIDIDILFYGEAIVQSSRLRVPHPRLSQRRFVLVPLAEIAPEFRHPVTGATVHTLLEHCPDHSSVEKVGHLAKLEHQPAK